MNTVATTEKQPSSLALRHELTVEDVIAQVQKIQRVMGAVMKEGEHYGIIPGTPKPTLYKAGAEKLCLTFRLDPQYESSEVYDGKHLTVKSRCTLFHITTGMRQGSGEGSCSTKETKYAYRQGKRRCPKCGADAIGKSKYPPRGAPRTDPGGWWCNGKGGGCGAEFAHNDSAVVGQDTSRVANDDLADQYNTILKMANKRALVAAVLNVTAASDIFTQDVEDLVEAGVIEVKATRVEPAADKPAEDSVPASGRSPSYDPFGAVTMIVKMAGGQFKPEALAAYFGPGVTSKTKLEAMKMADPALFEAGYDKLHADYLAFKTSGEAA